MMISEQPNYYRMTLCPSDNFTNFKTIQIRDGMLIVGRRNGKIRIQSILYSKATNSITDVHIRSFYYKSIFHRA